MLKINSYDHGGWKLKIFLNDIGHDPCRIEYNCKEHLYLAIGRSLLRDCFLDLSEGIKYFWPWRDDIAQGSHWNRETRKITTLERKVPVALYGINWVKGRNGWRLKKNDNKYCRTIDDDTSHLSCFNRFIGYVSMVIYIWKYLFLYGNYLYREKKNFRSTFYLFRHLIESTLSLYIHVLKGF